MGMYPLAGKHDEVTRVIVETIAILVMDNLAGQQGPTQRLLSNPAVSQYPFATTRVAGVGVDLTLSHGLPLLSPLRFWHY
ncbi:hypothetical protein GCM10010914_20880 [Deinococcus wulumuqiensis]|uniref:Uncharacterized protein n=1 Tax=Deinococcus wulumuqiensis TaxID=980427 RepID=A0AAV4K5N5_9DEIO|nr:hypothetical protein GCM10010914_20880 [Deinococcus wulumuqiensis]GGP30790.1 hypothetical protein GCM10008021_24410 [Deinococcus wulumuqiensis]